MSEIAPRPSLRLAAEAYARMGFHVFPCATRSKTPLTEHGYKDATTDIAQVIAWWTRWPDANIGIATGASGLLVVDVDGAEGAASLDELEREHGALPQSPMTRTGSGGRHAFLRAYAGAPSTSSRLGTKIDTRGNGGYVIAPPSVHPNGKHYEWIPEHTPRDLDIPETPQWVIDGLVKKTTPRVDTYAPSQHDSGRTRKYLLGALDRERESLRSAPVGTRNERLRDAAYALGGYVTTGFLDESEIRDGLLAACATWAERDERKDVDTLNRALRAGVEAPRDVPPPRAAAVPGTVPEDDTRTPDEVVVLEPAAHWIDGVWKTIGEREDDWLDTEPPAQRWFLTRDDGVPSCPRGIVGMLVAPGGRGKSMALIDLAICIATGRRWLDVYDIADPGPVAIILAEESEAEARRRLFRLARALELTPAEKALVRERVILLGLHGQDVALSHVMNDQTTPTATHAALSRLVRERSCDVILDPLVRFVPGAESNNVHANQAVLLLERLAESEGRTVIVAHHTAKVARRDGNQGDTSDARGVSGLTDSARWVANLSGTTEDDIAFRITKCNGVPPAGCAPVSLVREAGTGRLRAPSSLDRDVAKARAASMDRKHKHEVAAGILAAIAATPGLGKRDLRDAFKAAGPAASWTAVDDVLDELVEEGRVLKHVQGQRHSYQLGRAE